MESSTAVKAHERATGSSTIADLIALAAERHARQPGDPLQARRGLEGRQLPRARRDRLGGRPRADRPRHRAGRQGRDPVLDAAGVDLRRLRHHRDRRGRRADLRRRTRPRSASGSPATPSRARSSARTPSRWRRSAPSRATCRRSRRSSSSTRRATSATPSRSTTCASAAAARDPEELAERSRAVTRDQPYTIIYTSGTTGPPKGCVLSHGNYRDVVTMCEQDAVVAGGRRRLPVPAARALVRAADPAHDPRPRRDAGLLRRRPEADHPGAVRGQADLPPVGPAHLREALHAGHRPRRRRADQGGDAGRAEGARAPGRGPGGAARAAGALRRRRGEAVQERPRGVRRPAAPGHLRRGADRPGDPRVLLRLRRAGARGLRHDRDRHGVDGVDRRQLPLRLGRPRAARAGDQDRRRRRGAAQGPEHLPGLLQERRCDVRHADRRLDAHRRPRPPRRGRLPLHHRPQEGHHHHRGRQEPHAGQPRERPQAVALDLPGRDARRPPAVPGRADHARPRGDPALREGARPARGPRRRCRRSRR